MVREALLVPPRLYRVQQAGGQTISPEPVLLVELDTQLTMRAKELVLVHRWRVFVMQATVELRVTIQ